MDEILAKRYADAFIKYARETIGLEKAIEDCKNIKLILGENPEFITLLKAPEVGTAEKLRLIDSLPGEYFSQEFGYFLKLLLKKGRINKLNNIVEHIRVHYSFGVRRQVLLSTSYPAELEAVKQITEKLKEKFGSDIKLYLDLNGSLLGGVKAVIGNTVIDASVKRRLDELRKNLEEIRMA